MPNLALKPSNAIANKDQGQGKLTASQSVAERREFAFTAADYRFIQAWLKEQAGITLSDGKQELVYGRLTKRLRALNLKTFKDYRELLVSDQGASEVGNAVNALTTNLTNFFRESHHFDHLGSTVLSGIREQTARGGSRRLRIWSAGCSSGQEPYTIAITLQEYFDDLASWNAKILATDIDTNMVRKGQNGIYRKADLKALPDSQRKRYFEKVAGPNEDLRALQSLRSLIAFKPLNLMGAWPMKGPFDVIFCRNVIIYFDKPTQKTLMERFANILRPGGYLYLGHSESLHGAQNQFKAAGPSTFQKIA